MIVKRIKTEDIPLKQKGYKRTKGKEVKKIVDNFIKSTANSVEVIDDENLWDNSNNFRRSFQRYLNAHYITAIAVTIRGDRVFLIKG